jgi:hypothetical protein
VREGRADLILIKPLFSGEKEAWTVKAIKNSRCLIVFSRTRAACAREIRPTAPETRPPPLRREKPEKLFFATKRIFATGDKAKKGSNFLPKLFFGGVVWRVMYRGKRNGERRIPRRWKDDGTAEEAAEGQTVRRRAKAAGRT